MTSMSMGSLVNNNRSTHDGEAIAGCRALHDVCIMLRMKTTPMGRPRAKGPVKRPLNVTLDSRVIDGLRGFGDGNVSAGLALAVKQARLTYDGKSVALPDVDDALARGRETGTTTRKKVGRPIRGPERRVRTTIQIYAATFDHLRKFGEGVVARGIERAAVFVGAVVL